MSISLGEKRKMADYQRREKNFLPQEYGCEILLEKTTLEKVTDSSFPSDAYIIWYIDGQEQYIDLIRCNKKVNVFDMYYDKYGPGSVQKIEYGYGRRNPRLWGNKPVEKRKRK